MDRGRDRRFDDRAMGGETYRPTDRARSPPRGNTYRANRSPPRRAHTPPYVDTYAPGGGRPRSRSPRRRSRSPAYRGRNEGAYRGRPRSPPRAYSPRRDVNGRSSPPRARRYSRSPPPVKRRDPSPINNRRPRSPPPYVKQERYVSPSRERYDRRAYSPPRDRAPRFPQETTYRPRERSRSPVRRVEQTSRMASPDSSHRSTPQIHPDRLAAVTGSGTHSPAYRNNRAPPPARSPSYRERSPPRRAYSPAPVSPPPREREPAPYRQRTPPRRQSPPHAKQDHREEYRNGGSHGAHDNSMSAPVNGNLQNGNRGPPSGPGSSYRESPSGPPSAPLSMSAHSRAPPPFRPRGGPSYNREPRDPSFQGGPPPRRGGYGQGPPASPYSRGPSSRGHYDSGPPHGPRTGGGYNEHRSSLPFNPPPFRPNNSSSTTYPRTQRFNNPAPANTQPKIENHSSLAGMPSIVPGGKAAPSGLDPAAERRLQQLEEDKKKLEDMIAEKQRIKRQGLRDWETKERESARDGLRSELAEQSLENMGMGESNTGAAF